MKKLISIILLVSLGALGFASISFAGDDKCGTGLEGNWNVKHAGDTKGHLKHHLKIDKTGTGKYAVKIKKMFTMSSNAVPLSPGRTSVKTRSMRSRGPGRVVMIRLRELREECLARSLGL